VVAHGVEIENNLYTSHRTEPHARSEFAVGSRELKLASINRESWSLLLVILPAHPLDTPALYFGNPKISKLRQATNQPARSDTPAIAPALPATLFSKIEGADPRRSRPKPNAMPETCSNPVAATKPAA
jgi:hypothetical protein